MEAKLKKEFPFVEISDHLKQRVGEPDKETRLYRRYGKKDEIKDWFDAICEICSDLGTVSPGGVSMYAKVTRAAVHKRLKEGRLTGFLFHTIKESKIIKDRKKLIDGGFTSCLIPVSECKAWANDLKRRRDRIAAKREAEGKGHDGDNFMKPPTNWRKKIKK